ncbi:hypothetical protein OOK39_02325 [Streptomyces sp. NBC_00264]|uniref:hypothetical protein n=1 Tax=unclassified Streptomyces TaxID=2593676 RepID=UPI00225C3B16|nr:MULTISPECIES: hypothetical protein [unclassified Streptomyces]MCX5158137.1 hypothetical protein [Streptomyces sp. NBC_00305]MCX5216660.1 hypothetical protein [Streptomyces sp. NBC_00264]
MPEPTTRLAEIQARAAAATSGPWAAQPGDPGIVQALTEERLAVFGGSVQDYRDADFTAHARDDVSYLLGRVAELEAELEKHVGKKSTVVDENADDNRRRIYIDGNGRGWLSTCVEDGVEFVVPLEPSAWVEASVDEVAAVAGGLREIGRCW